MYISNKQEQQVAVKLLHQILNQAISATGKYKPDDFKLQLRNNNQLMITYKEKDDDFLPFMQEWLAIPNNCSDLLMDAKIDLIENMLINPENPNVLEAHSFPLFLIKKQKEAIENQYSYIKNKNTEHYNNDLKQAFHQVLHNEYDRLTLDDLYLIDEDDNPIELPIYVTAEINEGKLSATHFINTMLNINVENLFDNSVWRLRYSNQQVSQLYHQLINMGQILDKNESLLFEVETKQGTHIHIPATLFNVLQEANNTEFMPVKYVNDLKLNQVCYINYENNTAERFNIDDLLLDTAECVGKININQKIAFWTHSNLRLHKEQIPTTDDGQPFKEIQYNTAQNTIKPSMM